MNKLLVGLVCLLMPVMGMAADATVSWDAPTQYEDGTALPPDEISAYKVYIGTSASGPFTVAATVPGGFLSATITGLTRGTYYFYATTVATNNLESDPSPQVSKVVASNSKPRPPRNPR